MAKEMPKRVIDPTEFRIQASQFGDYYRDRLLLDAATNGSTAASAIVGNCKASLDRKEGKIDQKIRWMAEQRGVSDREVMYDLLGRTPVERDAIVSLREELMQIIAAMDEQRVNEAIALLKRMDAAGEANA